MTIAYILIPSGADMLDLIRPRRSSAPVQETEPGGKNAPMPVGSVASKLAGRWLVIVFCLVVWLGIVTAIVIS